MCKPLTHECDACKDQCQRHLDKPKQTCRMCKRKFHELNEFGLCKTCNERLHGTRSKQE